VSWTDRVTEDQLMTDAAPVGTVDETTVAGLGFPCADGEQARLVAAEVTAHDGFDRVTLRFDTRLPSYQVAFVEPPILQSGSGRQITLGGAAFLEVLLSPATAAGYPGEARASTYRGPSRLRALTGQVVTEAVVTGDVEATLVWTIGLRHRAAFAVAATEQPPQLMIDIVTAA
jgi:hypothetical protein